MANLKYLFKNALKLTIHASPNPNAKKNQAIKNSIGKTLLNLDRYQGLACDNLHNARKYLITALKTNNPANIIYRFTYIDKKTSQMFVVDRVIDSTMSAWDRLSEVKAAKREIQYQIRESRACRNVINYDQRYTRIRGQSVTLSKVGGVFTNPKTFLKRYLLLHNLSVFSEKEPKDSSKYIGVELEFISKTDRDELGELLMDAELYRYVTLKADGSVRAKGDYKYPHELCVLAKEEEFVQVMKRVCLVLKKADSVVNKTCGMHVHLDMRTRNKEVAFSNLVSAQPILYAMNPPSRQEAINGMRYCSPTKGKVFNSNMDRYRGINAAAYRRHQTIEVRIHAGTIDYTKIMNWVNILVKIVERPEAIKQTPRTFIGFTKKFDLTLEQCEYIVNRIKQFKDVPNLEEAA